MNTSSRRAGSAAGGELGELLAESSVEAPSFTPLTKTSFHMGQVLTLNPPGASSAKLGSSRLPLGTVPPQLRGSLERGK